MAPEADRDFRRDFYRAVDQRQATDPRQSQFYVPIYEDPALRAQDVVSTLRDGIDFAAGHSVQILSGFRGSGKTSELLRLRAELQKAGYAVVYMDVEDYFNTESPVDDASFAFALAAGFVDNSADQQVFAPDMDSKWDRLHGFLKRIKLDVGISAGPIDLKASLREDESFRGRVEQAVRTNRRQFREALHDFFADSAAALNNAVGTVFIVDSIDHFRGRTERFQDVRESVEMLFSEGAEDLTLPGLNVIYTVPVYVQPALGLRRDVLNIKVQERDGKPFEPGLSALRTVLERRAPGGDVERLLGTNVERLVMNSGGLIRDLLRLTSEVALVSHGLPATDAEIIRAESVVRSNMQLSLSLEQVTILNRVRAKNELLPAKNEWPDVADLMASGAVLRYPNGTQPWFGVHPLLLPLLDDLG